MGVGPGGTALGRAATLLGSAGGGDRDVMLAAAVPYDLDVETALDPALRERLAFARQNVDEVVLLFRAPHKGRDAVAAEFAAGRAVRGAATRDDRVRARLEAAGLRVVQVDAPALRELLPLRAANRPAYVAWPVDAFRLVTGGWARPLA